MSAGAIPGPTAHARAVHLAGILAELGITRLALLLPDTAPQHLTARSADLPGLITSAPEGSILESPTARITIHPDHLGWESTDDAFIRAANTPHT